MTPKDELNARQLIMKAALKLFADKGIDGVSVREISKESGQNISQISYYFESKEGLYKTILKEHSLLISQKVHNVIQEFSSENMHLTQFEKQMKNFISIFVNMRLENPDIAKIIQRETIEGMPNVKEIHNEAIKPLAGLMENFMNQAKKNKIVKKDTDERVFFILMTEAIWGYMTKRECKVSLLASSFKFPKDQNLFVDTVYNIFFKGILL